MNNCVNIKTREIYQPDPARRTQNAKKARREEEFLAAMKM